MFPHFKPPQKNWRRKSVVVKRWVVNASPIISLTKIDRIHLLSELCDEVVIPQSLFPDWERDLGWGKSEGNVFIQGCKVRFKLKASQVKSIVTGGIELK